MIKKYIIFIGILFVSYSGCSEDVSENKIRKPATAKAIQKASADLTLVGKALRKVYGFSVYTIQLLVSDSSQFDLNKPLESLNNQDVTAIHITAIRAVGGERMQKSMRKALQNNKVDIERQSIQQLLNAFNNLTSKEGDIFSFTGKRQTAGKEMMEVKLPGKETLIISESGIIRDVFSIWLGDTSHDSGLNKLKKQLLSGI